MKFPNLSYNQGIILAFAVGFVVRLIPELLSFPNPIGWDTIFYAYRISAGELFGFWNNPFSTWLLYGVLIFLGKIASLDPFLVLKIVAPLLFGGSAAGIYFVAWKKLNWSVTQSILASGVFVFQLAALTISWHFYRNIFGAMILLFALPFLKNDVGWKGAGVLSILGVLVALGHELAVVSMFFIIFSLLIVSFLKKEVIPYKLLVAAIPAAVIFVMGNLVLGTPSVGLDRVMLSLNDSIYPHPGNLFFLTDYLNVFLPKEFYNSYFTLFFHVFSLFFLLYAVLLPLIGIGYFKDRTITSWLCILLIGAFGCIIFPFVALILWHRWMLMLVYPFTFFAVNGLWRLLKTKNGISLPKFFGGLKFTRKFGIGLSLVMVVIGGLFISWPLVDGRYGIIGFESTFRYVPSTMQSSSVPLQDTTGTVAAFDWLNANMNGTTVLLAHDVFEFWTLLCLEQNHAALIFDYDLEGALEMSSQNGFTTSYFIWWNESIGWYNFNVPNENNRVQDFGRISVYEFIAT